MNKLYIVERNDLYPNMPWAPVSFWYGTLRDALRAYDAKYRVRRVKSRTEATALAEPWHILGNPFTKQPDFEWCDT